MGSLKKDIENVVEHFPHLMHKEEEGNNFLIGKIDVFDDSESVYFDTFTIKITIPHKYPYAFPKLYELEDKIPKTADRHVFTDSKACCLAIPQVIEIEERKGISIFDFIKRYVLPYLANQLYYENNPDKKWANGEYKHGFEGIVQYYCEVLEVSTLEELHKELKNYLEIKVKRNDKCFCGSGLKYKKCHLIKTLPLSKISTKTIRNDFDQLTEYLEKRSL